MCMLKKGLSLIMMGLLCTVLSTAAFASIQLNPVDDVTIEINEPRIRFGTTGLRQRLYGHSYSRLRRQGYRHESV